MRRRVIVGDHSGLSGMREHDGGDNAPGPVAVCRRRQLFAGSQCGGDATGILLSLIQSARVLGLDPIVYLTDVLRRLNGHPRDQLADLLPPAWQQARDTKA